MFQEALPKYRLLVLSRSNLMLPIHLVLEDVKPFLSAILDTANWVRRFLDVRVISIDVKTFRIVRIKLLAEREIAMQVEPAVHMVFLAYNTLCDRVLLGQGLEDPIWIQWALTIREKCTLTIEAELLRLLRHFPMKF